MLEQGHVRIAKRARTLPWKAGVSVINVHPVDTPADLGHPVVIYATLAHLDPRVPLAEGVPVGDSLLVLV